jgi:hypothetical protein
MSALNAAVSAGDRPGGTFALAYERFNEKGNCQLSQQNPADAPHRDRSLSIDAHDQISIDLDGALARKLGDLLVDFRIGRGDLLVEKPARDFSEVLYESQNGQIQRKIAHAAVSSSRCYRFPNGSPFDQYITADRIRYD